MCSELVTAIVPAYNAAATIDTTLRSIRSQTHRSLEVVVVDDGSTDATAAIVDRHVRADPRVRLVRQSNAGVAAARNRGISEAAGDFVAPIDADDLWAPTKLATQMAVMRDRGERVGLVYTWHANIDAEGWIIGGSGGALQEGDVLQAMCRGNIVGNGSATLVRKTVAVNAGGYDASLRARGAEGCEDIAFYIRVAESHHFGVVPQPLTGYRKLPGSMSTDGLKMYRSWQMVAREAILRLPHCRDALRSCTRLMARYAMRQDLEAGHYGAMLAIARRQPTVLAAVPRMLAVHLLKTRRRDRSMSQRLSKGAQRFEVGEVLPFD